MINLANSIPSVVNDLTPTINHYGYLAIFGLILFEDFGLFFIPGESVLIAAAFLADTKRRVSASWADSGSLWPALVEIFTDSAIA